ncbi:head-tail adaptor protein [Oceanomicrobium pacificus]|uniref:Head-tail adaptor protein n=1 Tax=Oceanomicrobium pacificus TaxID=2692916 RepID=A0A6B0TQV0_9RHOB|nr:head-tail adaptor protein [Oceanomicrobium pacificus]MXU66316.1 head-tail adaptor protein [Oceanomicrobium pacificus]
MARRWRLNRRLVLEAAEAAPDGIGGIARTWAPLGLVWAAVDPVAGRSERIGATDLARLRVRIIIRNQRRSSPARPQAGQRFRDGARLFDIEAVAEADPRGGYLVCWTREGQAR